MVEPGRDKAGRHKAHRCRDAERRRRALAHEITGVVQQLLNAAVVQRGRKALHLLGSAAGILPLLLAQLFIDLTGGIVEHRHQLVERARRLGLALIGIGARAIAGFALQLDDAVAERLASGR